MNPTKWPKEFPPLTEEQRIISNDFMKHWHEVLSSNKRFGLLEWYNHQYPIKHQPSSFLHTLEIGAGIGEHLNYEKLSPEQKKHYVAVEIRQSMAEDIIKNHPDVQVLVKDCQQPLPFADDHFDRVLAIHVLEHLPDLPKAIKELYRLCNKKNGSLSIVIPCEGGWLYSLARKISAQRIFERRYKQSYRWFIEREHINTPAEILDELKPYFDITHQSFFPTWIPSIHLNLCIGITLRPKYKIEELAS